MALKQDSSKKVIINGNVLLYEAKAPYTPSGHSLKGVLEYDPDEDKVMCHECGGWFYKLSSHIHFSHEMRAADYKERHGLQPSAALVNERLRAISIANGKKVSARLVAAGQSNYRNQQSERATRKKRRTLIASKNSAEFQNARRICPTQLLDRIKKCASAVGHTPTQRELREHGISHKTVAHRFGSMKNAMTLADLGYREPTIGRYSRRFLISMIRNFIGTHGRIPMMSDCRRGLAPSAQAFKNHFGSWSKAIIAAGYEPPSPHAGHMRTRTGRIILDARKPIPIQKASRKSHKKAARAHA